MGNGASHYGQHPAAAASGSAVTSRTGYTSLPSPKTEQKSSTFIEFLRVCGESMNADSQKIQNQRLTLDEELLNYKKCVLDFCGFKIPDVNAFIIF